ncbi:membrane glycoprotein LIG-1, putative [Ixodes scapularis]|uniref:Membrane glycoprotein LIG-1, putative n=1 Tax=Ixodes scapularis TaxID=6945 RepID=B7P101_IXOSC|nr:membrane glycoprotein LIG-1, putative [Ixodes scapularis]|eukprot:XP_002399763.1 membrane glycoprotein LIG-1, putative [Ixodes scapularis]
MGISRLVALLLCWNIFLAASEAAHCPDVAQFRPCTCDHEGINCMKANSAQELRKAFRATGANEHESLWIQKTPIQSFPAGVLGDFKFRHVHVEINANLTAFDLGSLNNTKKFLVSISLFKNALSSFDFKGISSFPKLLTLNLGKNKLRTIPAQAFSHPTLEALVLSENPIVSVGAKAFAGLRELRELFLSGTRLTTLGDNSMKILSIQPGLTINLADSLISSISRTAFTGTAPQRLDLSGNNLTTLSEDVFRPLLYRMLRSPRKFGEVPMIGLGNNPLSCYGCSFRWLVPLRTSRGYNSMLNGFACRDGTPFHRLTYSKIRCDQNGPF